MNNNQTLTATNSSYGLIKTKANDFRNYFLVVLILLFEDSPFFMNNQVQKNFWFVLFALLLIANGGKKRILNQKIVTILLVVWMLMIVQSALYGGGFTPAMAYKPLMLFYTPFLLFTLMGLRYFKYLFNVIYFIAVYTFVIYLLHSFIPPFYDWLLGAFDFVFQYSWADRPRTILIYSNPRISGYFFMRNSGIFHEPGAYSIYLMLAIVINTYFTRKVFNPKNLFLSFMVLTTFSTTGYVMLFLFLGYAVMNMKIHFSLKPVIIIPFAVVLIYAYQNTNFLKQKVDTHYTTQYEDVEEGNINKRGRFYAFGMSVKSFISNPITGRGVLTRHQYDVGEIGSFGYGFAGLFAMYGLFFGIYYMWYFYKGFVKMSHQFKMSKYYTLIAFITINLGLLTQAFFLNASFVYFFIVGLFYFVPPINTIKTNTQN